MQTYLVRIQGVSPLLMNRASPELLEQLRTKNTERKDRAQTPQAEAAKCIYRDGDGGPIVIPTVNLFASMAEAGREVGHGQGRSKVSTATSTKMYAFLSILEDSLPLVYWDDDGVSHPISDEGWVPDVRRGRNPADKVMVAICRPKFAKWGTEFTVELDNSLANPKTLEQLLTIAGRQVGLCDFRPGTKGPFGRFKVIKMEKIAGDDTPDVEEKVPATRVKKTAAAVAETEGTDEGDTEE